MGMTISDKYLLNPDTEKPFIYQDVVLNDDEEPEMDPETKQARSVKKRWTLFEFTLRTLSAAPVQEANFEDVERYARVAKRLRRAVKGSSDPKVRQITVNPETHLWLLARCKKQWGAISGRINKDLIVAAWEALNGEIDGDDEGNP